MTTPEFEPNSKTEFQDLLELVHQIMPSEAERLAYDDDTVDTAVEPDDETEIAGVEVGNIWDVDPGLLREGESVSVCVCSEQGRYHLGALLRAEHNIEPLPVAFIELKVEREAASFSAMAYLLESGAVAALVDTAMDEDAVLSEESEDCFDFANQLGLGSQWAKAMFQVVNPGMNTTSEVIDLDGNQIEKLYGFLNPLENRV